ncbi:hypothetical protein F3Y22_tig00109945pilonHSYRG00315 [Hibiscus syriacus]|uniref:MADS-box domain-containing protein n=1 Tax=Hibiscus syriacus TaxID=106335 RepID=A0A6A3BVX9_HIBSY|nr:hypothetical protein F3Y22_tig00109945pilonHSYRG00315 [Hibiscus syriacus]
MTKKKIKLTWITNNTSRRASLKTRRHGLVKKVKELTTLCGIEAYLLLYSLGEQEPMVRPSPDEVKRLIEKFHLVPELQRVKKMMNTENHMIEKHSKGDVPLQPPPSQGPAAIANYEIGSSSARVRDNKREAVELLSCRDWFQSFMNTNNFRGAGRSSVQSDIGLSLYSPYIAPGSSSVVPQFRLLGPSNGGNSSIVAVDLGLPGPSITDNPKGFSRTTTELVTPTHPFGGSSSSAAVERVPQRHHFSFGGSSSVAAVDQGSGLPSFETFSTLMADTNMTECGYFSHEMGPGRHPSGPVRSGSPTT